MRYVILPQALRIATPPTVGFLVQIVKNTSLASVIGFVELTRAGQIINNATFEPFVVYADRRRALFRPVLSRCRWCRAARLETETRMPHR